MEQSDWKKTRQEEVKRRIRMLGFILFLVYIAFLVYYLFFADWYEHAPGIHLERQRNLVPFVEIRRSVRMLEDGYTRGAFLNLIGNVVGFLPFGFFLPVISGRLRHLWKVLLLALAFSLGVEAIQLLTKSGRFDVDDVILNTLGASLGYLLFLIVDAWRKGVMRRHVG